MVLPITDVCPNKIPALLLLDWCYETRLQVLGRNFQNYTHEYGVCAKQKNEICPSIIPLDLCQWERVV